MVNIHTSDYGVPMQHEFVDQRSDKDLSNL